MSALPGRLIVLLLAAAVAVVAFVVLRSGSVGNGAAGEGGAAEPEVRGRALYGYCVTCHGPDGKGKPGQAPSLVDSRIVRRGPDTLLRVLLDGVRSDDAGRYAQRMTGFRHLRDEDLARLAEYVLRLAGLPDGVEAEDVVRIRGETRGRREPWSREELLDARRP